MFCEDCNSKDANVYMTTAINGEKVEISLCEECANKKETLNMENNFSMHSFLASLLTGSTTPNINIKYKQNKKCPQCGSTYNNFKQNGRLGCNVCYDTFSDMLLPLIRRIQGNTIHGGKVPKRCGASIILRKEVKDLKYKLQQLVAQEEFEEAANIRDEIKKLEGHINSI